jgi:hypothetical protein
MGGVVIFDYGSWATRYPELAAWVSPSLAQLYFNEAALYCDNTPTSIIQDLTIRAMLLNMVTAHIARLNAALNGQASSPIVGRISNATEGSVNVTAELNLPAGSAQWFAQTKYGASYWQATAIYRSMRYVPGRRPIANPWNGPFRH